MVDRVEHLELAEHKGEGRAGQSNAEELANIMKRGQREREGKKKEKKRETVRELTWQCSSAYLWWLEWVIYRELELKLPLVLIVWRGSWCKNLLV